IENDADALRGHRDGSGWQGDRAVDIMEIVVLGAIVLVDPRVLDPMIGQVPGGSRYQSLRHSQRALERMAPLVRFGVFAVGVSVFLDQVRGLVSDAQFTWGERRVMGLVALVTVGG